MKEIISIHIGQCGIQLGNSFWEIFCLEHGIQPDGRILSQSNTNFLIFFSENKLDNLKYTPRSIFIDLEPTLLDEIRISKYKQLFNSDQLIAGKEDTGNNYARGYYTLGNKVLDLCMDKIRKLADNCEDLEGFIVSNAVGGGTGSGLGTLLLERLNIDYGKKTRLNLALYPFSKISTAIIEPYNTLLATSGLCEYSDVTIVFDNEAIYDICKEKLGIDRPGYTNLNRLITHVYSSLTAPIRYIGFNKFDLKEIETNLIPYPRIHFILPSYAPIIPSNNLYNEKPPSVAEITMSTLESPYTLAKCDINYGKYMAACLMYRGDVVPKDISASIACIKVKKTIEFVHWIPTGFKCMLNPQPLVALEGDDKANTIRSACIMANHTAISEVFTKTCHQFDMMYSKRAFIHWYLREGMEEQEFSIAKEEIDALQKDYEEIANDVDNEDEMEG